DPRQRSTSVIEEGRRRRPPERGCGGRQDAGPMYRSVTRSIQVTVRPIYLDGESDPEAGRWVWAYTIEIINMGPETVCLRARHWRITDAKGRTEEVCGPGVVGEQPVLAP